MPLVQLVILGYAFGGKIKNLHLGVVDEDHGIPAIKIGSGGSGGRAHSLEEWIDVDKDPSLRGMSATLTAILAVAGVAA